jgi:hypothetical protein
VKELDVVEEERKEKKIKIEGNL